MAARLNPKTQLSVRERIQATQIAKLLQAEALGKKVLKPGQRTSAIYLLNQALGMPPQMTDVQLTGNLVHNDISDKPLTIDQWATEANSVGTTDGASSPTH